MQRCPTEIVQEIISYAEPRYKVESLLALSLTCRAVSPSAQEALFRIVALHGPSWAHARITRFFTYVPRRPILCGFVRELHMSVPCCTADGARALLAQLANAAPLFARVRTLALQGWSFTDDAVGAAAGVFAGFRGVHTLSVGDCAFPRVEDMHAFVAYFPALRELTVRHVRWGTAPPTDYAARPNVLEGLDSCSIYNARTKVPALLGWALEAPSSLRTLTLGIHTTEDAQAASGILLQCKALRRLDLFKSFSVDTVMQTDDGVPVPNMASLSATENLTMLHISTLATRSWQLLLSMLASLPTANQLATLEVTRIRIRGATAWHHFWVTAFLQLDRILALPNFAALERVELNLRVIGASLGELEDLMPLTPHRGILHSRTRIVPDSGSCQTNRHAIPNPQSVSSA